MVRAKSAPVRSLAQDLHVKMQHFRMVYRHTEREHLSRRSLEEEEHVEAQAEEVNVEPPKFTHVHPLAGHEQIPELTDIQRLITDAIMSCGPSVTFDQIQEFVSHRWKGMRRKDGTLYSADCKRAIQANLRSNPTSPNLFRRDPEDKAYWQLCSTIEQATMSSKSASKETRKEESTDTAQQSEDAANEEAAAPPEDMTDEEKAALLTPLQNLMTQVIVEKGCCHVDEIYNFVKANNAKMLKGRDGPASDCRRAVLASLSKNIRTSPLFWRADESHHGWWKLGKFNPFFSEELNTRADEVMATVAVDEDDEDEEMLDGEENGLDGEELSGLARVIAEALAYIGGEGTAETIVEVVSVQWDQEDDCQTVVESFLAEGDTALFKSDPKQEGVWLLTKQGRALVAELGSRDSRESDKEEEAESSEPVGDPMEVEDDVNGDSGEEEPPTAKSTGRMKREKSPSKPRTQRVTRSRVKTSESPRADKRQAAASGASPASSSSAYPTQLQERIKELIVDSGGSCNGEFIVNTITEESSGMTQQARRELLGTDDDPKKVITTVLTAPKKPADQLFKRDVNSDGCWMLSRKGLRAWPDAPPTSNIPLTDMQAEIVQIIALNGGKASIKSILNEVPKSTIKMRRREAGTDFAKAIRTCLTTSMSSGKPMFKKASNKEDVWKVADKTVQEGVLQRYDNVLSKRRSKSPSPAAPSAKRKKR